MLSYSDKENILSDFPNIKLSYENIVYKKVYNANVNLAIPEGKKCFAWFTRFNEENVCLIMELSENKQINDIKITNVCFSSELSYGTILYGTIFNYSYNNFFTIEDIFSYKGKNIERENWGNKFITMKRLFTKDIKQLSYNNSFLVFGLPLLSDNLEDLIKIISNVKYNIDSIQFRSFNRSKNYLFMNYKSFMEDKDRYMEKDKDYVYKKQPITIEKTNLKQMVRNNTKREIKEIVFQIKPDIQNDVYHLYYHNNDMDEEYYGNACIPDYSTSVMMNTLFRNIKENKNLDALEESDDEEEFENEREDRFVYLDKTFKMLCVYNYKFKKWTPLKEAGSNAKIVLKKDLPIFEKK
jgi:hypothetical protein